MEGWLTKKGHRFKSWKKRWFVLDREKGFVLSYFEKENKKNLKGSYILSASSRILSVPNEGSHKNLFELQAAGSGGDLLLMSAENDQVKAEWIRAIDEMIIICREALARAGRASTGLSSPLPPTIPPRETPPRPARGSGVSDITAALLTFPKHGLKLSGFREFIDLCGGPRELHELTTAVVCEQFVKRFTFSARVSYCTKLLAASSEHVGIATHFISHAWRYKFLDTYSAILDHFDSEPDAIVWFDVFSNNQHIAPNLDFNWWSTTFQSAIDQFGHTVVVFSPWNDPIPLTRAWCLYEIYCSALSECKLDVAICARDVADFLDHIARDTEAYFKMLCNIDVRKSESWNPRDKEQIFDAIEKSIGFDNINKMISAKMQKWVTQSLESNLSDSDAEVSVKRKIALAEIYRLQGSFLPALDLYREALRQSEHLDNADTEWVSATCYNGIGQVYDSRGKHKESLEYYQKSLEKRLSINEDVGGIYNNMAVVYANQGEYDQALQYYEKALEAMVVKLGENHPDVGACFNNIAVVYANQDRYREALRYYEKALGIEISVHGDRHPSVGGTFCNIAGVEDALENFDQALVYYEKALQIFTPTLGECHPSIGGVYFNLAMVYSSKGDTDKVLECYNKAITILVCTYGDKHHSVGDIHMNIASVCANQGKYDEALVEYEKALAILTESTSVGKIYNGMAMICYSQERFEEALSYYDKSLEVLVPIIGVNNADIAATYSTMGSIYQYLSDFDSALVRFTYALSILTAVHGPGHCDTVSLYKRIMTVYEAQGNAKKSLEYRKLLSMYG